MREAQRAGSHPQPAARRGPPRVILRCDPGYQRAEIAVFVPVSRTTINNKMPPKGGTYATGPPKPGGRQSRQKRPAGPRRPPGATSPGRAPQGEDPPPAGGGRAKGDPGRREGPGEGRGRARRRAEGDRIGSPKSPEGQGKAPTGKAPQRGPGGASRKGAEPGRGPARRRGPPGGAPAGARRRAPAPIGRASERGTKRAVPRSGRRSPSGRGPSRPKAGAGQTAARGGQGPEGPLKPAACGGQPGTGEGRGAKPREPPGPGPGAHRVWARRPTDPGEAGELGGAQQGRAAAPFSGSRRWSLYGGGTTTPPHGCFVLCATRKVVKKIRHGGRHGGFFGLCPLNSCENRLFGGLTPPPLVDRKICRNAIDKLACRWYSL